MFNFNTIYKKHVHKLNEAFDFNAVSQETANDKFQNIHKETMAVAFKNMLDDSLNTEIQWSENKDGQIYYTINNFAKIILKETPELQIFQSIIPRYNFWNSAKPFIWDNANILYLSYIFNLCIDNHISLNLHNNSQHALYINIESIKQLEAFTEYININQQYNSCIYVFVKILNYNDIEQINGIVLSEKYPYVIIPYNIVDNKYDYPYIDMLTYIVGQDYKTYLYNTSDIIMPSEKRFDNFIKYFNALYNYLRQDLIYNSDNTYTQKIIGLATFFLYYHIYFGPDSETILAVSNLHYLFNDVISQNQWNSDIIKDVAAMMLYMLNK